MNTLAQPLPWWKTEKLYDKLNSALIPTLIIGLLIYSLAKIDNLSQDIVEIREEMAGLKVEMAEFKVETKGEITGIAAEIIIIKSDTSRLREDTSHLREDTSRLREDVTDLKAGQQQILYDFNIHQQEHASLAE